MIQLKQNYNFHQNKINWISDKIKWVMCLDDEGLTGPVFYEN